MRALILATMSALFFRQAHRNLRRAGGLTHMLRLIWCGL